MRYWIFGFRINNVINSNNRARTFTSELFGFGVSYFAGYIGGSLAVALALGPLGWFIAIIVIGAAVVAADYAGKALGNLFYDAGAYSSEMLTLTY